MPKEQIKQNLPYTEQVTEQLKKAGIKNVVGNFGDLVDELTDIGVNRDGAFRIAQLTSGYTVKEIAVGWEKNGFEGLTPEAVRQSINKGLQKLNEQDD